VTDSPRGERRYGAAGATGGRPRSDRGGYEGRAPRSAEQDDALGRNYPGRSFDADVDRADRRDEGAGRRAPGGYGRPRPERGRDAARSGSYARSAPDETASRPRGSAPRDDARRGGGFGARPGGRSPGRTPDHGQGRPGRSAERRPQARGDDRAADRGADRTRLPLGDDMTADRLDREAMAELRTLPADLADSVARHLVAAGLLDNPELAYLHAKEARRLAARVGVVREAVGIAAYRAGEWAEALAELRAARRLTGRNTSLAMMADSERALGRLDRALAIVQSPEAKTLDRASQIELKIVESGIRRDQDLPEAGVVALQVPELTSGRVYPWSVRLYYAYADALLDAGRTDEARAWFGRAAALDDAGETDATDRFDDLDDATIEDLAEDDHLADEDLIDGRASEESANDELADELANGEPGDNYRDQSGIGDSSITESGWADLAVTEKPTVADGPAAAVPVAGSDVIAGIPAVDDDSASEVPAGGDAALGLAVVAGEGAGETTADVAAHPAAEDPDSSAVAGIEPDRTDD
jgi:tetratricopeptide (TPR) repeat protein